ncbi:hypothetical protein BGX28_009258 [Mortierella sp. GBA30]|nr:hypothetical protein BGX28_009258 [Mortierella sp. GBA30]
MPETLTFFCLVNGETASTAFPIKISSGDTIGDLKELIRTKMAVQFSDIDANQLTLWKISIPIVAEEKHKVISLDCLVSKDELLPSDELPEVFGDNPLKKTIHILVHRPPREKDLNIDTIFNIIIKDKIPQTLEWTTNPKTATLDELRDHIHASLPRLHGERRKIGFDHPKSKPFPEGGVDWLVADAKLRTILKMYIQGGLSDMNLYLEFPQKGFSSFSLDDVKTRLRVMHFGVFHVERVPCNTGERKEVLDRLYVALELARDTIGEILNEGCATRFIGPFLMAAVTLFPDLQLTPERGISGRWGTGSVDYMIESRNAPESNMLGVVEAKQGKTYDDGLSGQGQTDASDILRDCIRCKQMALYRMPDRRVGYAQPY